MLSQRTLFTLAIAILILAAVFNLTPSANITTITSVTSITQFLHKILPSYSISGQKPFMPINPKTTTAAAKTAMSKLSHAAIIPRRSAARGHADHGWLNSYHTFSFADYYDPNFMNFGCLRVLNEDRVAPQTGFPTHPHRDAEIFSYILSGELTHRDSMLKKGEEGKQGKDFYRMKRGDVQFTTGGTGIAHSEQNEHSSEVVHFLQIWATPWRRGLTPQYHTVSFDETLKRQRFLPILSPLAAGKNASAAEEKEAKPKIPGTIPIHADFVMGAGIIPVDRRFKWTVGCGGSSDEAGSDNNNNNIVESTKNRHVYVHLPMTKNGNARIRLDGREEAVLREGDGAFVKGVNVGDEISVESIGEAEAEVVILDSN